MNDVVFWGYFEIVKQADVVIAKNDGVTTWFLKKQLLKVICCQSQHKIVNNNINSDGPNDEVELLIM